MKPVPVSVSFDIDCDWQGMNPVYRVYVNDELFSERTWRWTDHFLRENLVINAVPKQRYIIKLQPVGPQIAKFFTSRYTVNQGPATWIEDGILEILDESQ